jgi:hypothetical protein
MDNWFVGLATLLGAGATSWLGIVGMMQLRANQHKSSSGRPYTRRSQKNAEREIAITVSGFDANRSTHDVLSECRDCEIKIVLRQNKWQTRHELRPLL